MKINRTDLGFFGRPLRLFANRTSAIIYVNTFIISMLNYWIFFFLPLYFQAVKLSAPITSGVQILPSTLIAVPGAAVGAVTLTKWGKYKLLHIVGFAILVAGLGSLSVLDRDSNAGEWVGLQIPPSIGLGMVLLTLQPAFQAGVGRRTRRLRRRAGPSCVASATSGASPSPAPFSIFTAPSTRPSSSRIRQRGRRCRTVTPTRAPRALCPLVPRADAGSDNRDIHESVQQGLSHWHCVPGSVVHLVVHRARRAAAHRFGD